ncbi:MAG TPA: Sir2 family NAD-dependent protein deacetylase [Terriglobales bacterium]|nr:Sir2 family NAD-dependent protein deacetylase [Terriglobales bacterium]
MIEINATDRVFVLTGAGISAESGIPTFRDFKGLWRGVRPEDVATPEAWARDPRIVWQFYSERRRQALTCKPNPAHLALAGLERQLGERLFVCTQNVDNLHEQAGSKRVVHMHGELFKSRCERNCADTPFDDERVYRAGEEIARCKCGGRIRPHVCWFGEMPYELDAIFNALENCTVFITVGSSGLVEPAASFAIWAGRNTGAPARRYYIGAETPANYVYFDKCFVAKAGELLPALFRAENNVEPSASPSRASSRR